MDCGDVPLPFGPQFVSDIAERTTLAENQTQARLAADVVLTAQGNATRPLAPDRNARHT